MRLKKRYFNIIIPIVILSVVLLSCTKPFHQLIEEREQYALLDSVYLRERIGDQTSIELTVDEAIEFAINYNLNLRVLQAQLRIDCDAINDQLIRMLPDLNYNAISSLRSNLLIASSTSVIPDIPPAPASFSSLREENSYSVEFGWNILNTAIQYFFVKEAKNNMTARELTYLRTTQDLIQQVVTNYWIVASLQQSAQKLQELTRISVDLADRLRKQVDLGNLALQQATEVIGRIYYQQIQAKQYLRSYWDAKERIKNLLGIPPEVDLIVKVPDETHIPGPLPDPEALHIIALTYRPELYGTDVSMAISQDRLRRAIVTMFPELTPFVSINYDDNPFFEFNYWTTVGYRVLYRLITLPISINQQITAKDEMCLHYNERLLTSLAVLSQIHIAYALYEDARSRFLDAHIYWIAKKNSHELALAKKNLNAIADLDYVFPLSDLAYAETQKNLFYAEMMGYLEQINNSIGIPRNFTEYYQPMEVGVAEKQQSHQYGALTGEEKECIPKLVPEETGQSHPKDIETEEKKQ